MTARSAFDKRRCFGLVMAFTVMAACLYAESRQWQAFCDFVRLSSLYADEQTGEGDRLVSLARAHGPHRSIVYAPESAGFEIWELEARRSERSERLRSVLRLALCLSAAACFALPGRRRQLRAKELACADLQKCRRRIINYIHHLDGEK